MEKNKPVVYMDTDDVRVPSKFAVLMAAIRYFLGMDTKLFFSKDINIDFDKPGLMASMKVYTPSTPLINSVNQKWQRWSVTFDGRIAEGFIDGKKVY